MRRSPRRARISPPRPPPLKLPRLTLQRTLTLPPPLPLMVMAAQWMPAWAWLARRRCLTTLRLTPYWCRWQWAVAVEVEVVEVGAVRKKMWA